MAETFDIAIAVMKPYIIYFNKCPLSSKHPHTVLIWKKGGQMPQKLALSGNFVILSLNCNSPGLFIRINTVNLLLLFFSQL